MPYVPEDQVIFTNKAIYRMKYHKLYENEVLLTFNYPDKTKTVSSFFASSVYESEKDFGTYFVSVVSRYNQYDKKWIIITCWKSYRQKKKWWRPIEWWWANILGQPKS